MSIYARNVFYYCFRAELFSPWNFTKCKQDVMSWRRERNTKYLTSFLRPSVVVIHIRAIKQSFFSCFLPVLPLLLPQNYLASGTHIPLNVRPQVVRGTLRLRNGSNIQWPEEDISWSFGLIIRECCKTHLHCKQEGHVSLGHIKHRGLLLVGVSLCYLLICLEGVVKYSGRNGQ